jgi:hypothetical protein
MFDLRARAAFLQVFQFLLIQRQPPRGENSQPLTIYDCKPVKITAACFEEVVSLVMEACSRCDQQSDAWCGKTIMTIVQFVICDGEGGRELVLLNRVYNHPIWNKVSFWEQVLIVGICEAHASEAIWRRHMPNHGERPSTQAVLNPFIDSFVRLMSQFGIKGDQARSCIREALKRGGLGPSAGQYATHLIKQIDMLEAHALAASKAAADNAVSQPNFNPPPRQLEERSSEKLSPEGLADETAKDGVPSTRAERSEPVEARTTTEIAEKQDSSEGLAAVALGAQDGFPEANANSEDGMNLLPTATTTLESEASESTEPADILGSIGVDHADVFG